MSTQHNPINFQPEEYKVLGYFDNRPPQYFWGMSPEAHNLNVQAWHKEREALFPDANCYRCEHCGNGNVRYVVACLHKPTGEHVCFGDICIGRLNFPDHDAFRAEMIRSAAQQAGKRAKLEEHARAFAAEHGLTQALEDAAKPEHAANHFVQDIFRKLFQWGSLSPRQVECVLSSMAKDVERAATKAAQPKPTVPAPEGKVTVRGKVVSVKWKQSEFHRYAGSYKMLVVADEGFKVWCTVPAAFESVKVGERLEVTADWKQSPGDKFFAFGKRPKVSLLPDANAPQGELALGST